LWYKGLEKFIRDSAIIGAGLAGMTVFPKGGRAAAKSLRLITPEADPTQVKVWRGIFEAFASKHPGIEVKGEYKKWDDITKKLAADLAAGNPPELVAGSSKPDFVAEQFKR
jgi:ABC-type glycerol-3-phosphate transport system substrate-binding protein